MTRTKRYAVTHHRRVRQRLRAGRLPKRIVEKYYEFAEGLETDPRPPLRGLHPISEHWYRCHLTHDWRVEWMVDDEERTVVITHLGPREEK